MSDQAPACRGRQPTSRRARRQAWAGRRDSLAWPIPPVRAMSDRAPTTIPASNPAAANIVQMPAASAAGRLRAPLSRDGTPLLLSLVRFDLVHSRTKQRRDDEHEGE